MYCLYEFQLGFTEKVTEFYVMNGYNGLNLIFEMLVNILRIATVAYIEPP